MGIMIEPNENTSEDLRQEFVKVCTLICDLEAHLKRAKRMKAKLLTEIALNEVHDKGEKDHPSNPVS